MDALLPSADAVETTGSDQRQRWMIAIYAGPSPLALSPAPGAGNPVLTRRDVIDVEAKFVADPFFAGPENRYLFFEVVAAATGRGVIAVAERRGGFDWRYRQVVLDEPFHLSYPQVFEWRGVHYMIPETQAAGAVRLYRATRFPFEWKVLGDLLDGAFADPSICRRDGRWWLFAGTDNPRPHGTLRLFGAEHLEGPWSEHPASPLVEDDPRIARPAGRITAWNGGLLRFAQDCGGRYGTSVRAFRISDLTPERYREEEVAQSPILGPGSAGWSPGGWNLRMHHVDPRRLAGGRWIAAVDGNDVPPGGRRP